jgi:uncharacterized protein
MSSDSNRTRPSWRPNTVARAAGLRLAGGLVAALCLVSALGCSQSARLNLWCTTGDLARCKELGDLYLAGAVVPRDVNRAAELYRKVCDGRVFEVCNLLGELYEHLPGTTATTAEITNLFERACSGSVPAGCLNLGMMLQGRGDLAQAVELFDRACSSGEAIGCFQLALALERGEGVERDVARALQLYETSCNDFDHVDSCLALNTIYFDGEIVEKDLTKAGVFGGRAIKIYDEGCAAGNQRDCAERDRIKNRVILQAASK